MIEPQNKLQNEIQSALDCWFITGATASGKTEVSMAVAERVNAEIISLDSMAIYRGMDIGTAKPEPRLRLQVPHHLIDICDPTESFSVNEYRSRALETIADIRSRDKQVIFVGGTALYLKAMIRGIFEGPPADWEFRKQIEAEIESAGIEALHKRLAQVDPLAAHKLHPNDRRRIIRALEVHKLTGQPISHMQNEFEVQHKPESCKVFSLLHSRERLHDRIQQRVEWMFEHGLVEEVRTLMDRWGELSHTASQAVGYREVIDHLNNDVDLEETKKLVLYRTRQFARHQETWFRGLAECRAIILPDEENAESLAEEIITAGQNVDTR